MNTFLFIESRKDGKTLGLEGMGKQNLEGKGTQTEKTVSIFLKILDREPLFSPQNH